MLFQWIVRYGIALAVHLIGAIKPIPKETFNQGGSMDKETFEHEMSRAKTFQVKSFLKNLTVGIGLVVLFTHMSSAQWVQTNGPWGGDVLALAVSGSNIFAALVPGGVYRSTNNGTSWTAVDSGLPANIYVTSLAVSSSNIFAGTLGGGVFLSTNSGTSWTAVDSGLPAYTNVYSLAVTGDSNIFAGTEGGVFLSTNSGTSWTAVNYGLTNTLVPSLAVSGSNIFAGTGGGVFLSSSNGTSWTAVNSGLTNTYVYSLAVTGSNIFAGTDGGVFLSTNSGTSWTAVNSGLPEMRFVMSLAVSGGNIFAGTHGSGVWRRPLSEMLGVINPISQGKRLNQVDFDIRSPSRTNHNATIEFSLPHSEQVTAKVYNLSGREIATPVNGNFGSGSYSITWNTRNIAAGCYTVRMQTGSKTFAKSIAIFQ